jgi:hypothetical protein
MLKAGAHNAATGENAVIVCSRSADVIIGPIGIVIADALLGEITTGMAAAVGQSNAKRILIPMNQCNSIIAGVSEQPIGNFVQKAINLLKDLTRQS